MCQPTVIALKTVNTPHSKCRRKHCLQHDWHLDKVNWTYVDTPSRDCILNTRQIQDRNKQFVHPSSHSYQQQKHVQWMAQSSLCSWQTLLSTSRRKIRLQCADILWSFDLTRQVTDDIVNSTYSTLLNTPSRDYNDNHVTVVRSQSYAWGSPRPWLVLWVSYGRHANSHSTSNNAH